MMNHIVGTPKINNRKGDISKRWFVEYYTQVPGTNDKKRVQLYGNINSFATEKERMKAANKILNSLIVTNKEAIVKNRKFALLCGLGRFLVAKRSFWRKKTYQTYKSKLRVFWTWCRDNWNGDVFSEKDADRFLDWIKKDRSNLTYNAYLGRLSAFFSHYQNTNPFAHIKELIDNSEPFMYFNDYQRAKLKDLIFEKDRQLYLVIQMVYYCFLRPNAELRFLRVGDVFLAQKKIRVRSHVSKNNTYQYVSIPEPLYQYFLQIDVLTYPTDFYLIGKYGTPSDTHVSSNFLTVKHLAYLKACGLNTKIYKLYSWKHTGIKALVDAGVNLPYIQHQCRHHSLEMLQRYLRKIGLADMQPVQTNFPAI